MNTNVATREESPLSKFDAQALKNISSQDVSTGAPRASFLPSNMGEAMEVAKLMAAGNFVPPHLRGKAGDCLAVVMQAARWGMDPFAVGNKTYFVNDRMAYESQLVNAVINSSSVLDGRLQVEWEGAGDTLTCTVTGKVKGDVREKTRRVELRTITTKNSPLWKQDPHQQIAYFTTRAWVRLHAPEVLLGVYTPDEIDGHRPIDGGSLTSQPLTAEMLIGQSQDIEQVEGEVVAQPPANDGTLSAENPTAAEGPADEDRGEAHVEEAPAWAAKVKWMKDTIGKAKNGQQIKEVEGEYLRDAVMLPQEVADEIEGLMRAKRAELSAAKAQGGENGQ